MKRIGMVAIHIALLLALAGAVAWPSESAIAQSSSGTRLAQAAPEDTRVPRRAYHPPTRLRVTPYYQGQGVYPHYYPGPDAVRVCNAHYVQEFRPSGTVIVPRMSCHWTRG